MVSIAPAEKPIMPMRSGSTCHSAARSRTRAKAALASAICGAKLGSHVLGASSDGLGERRPRTSRRIERSNADMSCGVWLRRYLSTNAATPFAASARATSQPSFSIDSVRKPPPGATITAAPVAFAGSGRKGVSVATVTLRANVLPYWLCHDSGAVAPGSGAGAEHDRVGLRRGRDRRHLVVLRLSRGHGSASEGDADRRHPPHLYSLRHKRSS